jgi:hypothetical protein
VGRCGLHAIGPDKLCDVTENILALELELAIVVACYFFRIGNSSQVPTVTSFWVVGSNLSPDPWGGRDFFFHKLRKREA